MAFVSSWAASGRLASLVVFRSSSTFCVLSFFPLRVDTPTKRSFFMSPAGFTTFVTLVPFQLTVVLCVALFFIIFFKKKKVGILSVSVNTLQHEFSRS